MTREQGWLAAMWPKVESHLPPPPASVVEVGCGRLGGFIPNLRAGGYEAVGIDPAAPDGDDYRQTEFERSDLPAELDAVIACTSLHHVTDPGEVLEKIANNLSPAGRVIVVEWDWGSFDEPTARWGFERLGFSDGESWLQRRRDEWASSGQTWERYLHSWANGHGIHGGRRVLRELEQRFERLAGGRGAYLFPALAETTEAAELEAINAGRIRALRIDYVGRPG